MIKNIKSIFFILTLVMLLVTVSAVCAADDKGATTDNTNTTTASSIKEKTTTTESVVKEKIEKTPIKEKTDKTQTKQIIKTNKTRENTKTNTKTVEVNNIDELTSAIDTINSDINNDNYIINFNEGNYQITSNSFTLFSNKTIIINGNYQTLNYKVRLNLLTFEIKNLTLNNLNVNTRMNFNGTSTLNNITFNHSMGVGIRFYANSTIINCTFPYKLSTLDYSNVIITKSILNATMEFDGYTIIKDDCILGENYVLSEKSTGTIISNITGKNTDPYDGNKEITNENITTDTTIPITGNITFTNCQINAKITNQGNLTLVNCSLSNNNMTISGSKTDGFLLENKGNATLIDCRVENNTFTSNITYSSTNDYTVYGAMYNNGLMNIINSTFSNNILQACEDSFRLKSYGVCITNNETLNIFDSIFEKNQLNTRGGGAIFNLKNASLNVNNTTFQGNQGGNDGNGSSICIAQKNIGETSISNASYNITNSKFNNNSAQTGGAIFIDDLLNGKPTLQIENCIFTNNNARVGGAIRIIKCDAIIKSCIFDKNSGNGILKCGKDSVYDFYSISNVEVDNCSFTNNYGNDILYTEHNTNVTNSLFKNNTGNPSATNGSIVHIRGTSNYINNTFKNNSESNYLLYDNIGLSLYEGGLWGEQTTIFSHLNNETIINNTFIDNKVTIGTIFSLEPDNITKQENKYINTSIDDNLTLNIPNKIYSGEAITITGTYTINIPDNYDADILDQNKFNIYINGVLNQTVDTLDFTVTPTAGTMMVTVQPTISQTRKTQAIRATTLTDITITPENYNEYIYEGVLVGVSKDTRVKFSGEFTDKGDIVFDTNNLIIDGTNATFTNTTFTLDNENITLQNMKINNNEIQYTIINAFDNNIIANNTITVTNTQKTGAAIYNTASNTLIENNTITQTAPAYDIDFSTGQGVASTQAILLLGGDKNTVQNNNINIEASSSSAYGTLEAITNNNDATNTIITQNTINISGANFNYAIDSLNNVENITITENTITVTGERYCDGIQSGNGATNILVDNNNITCICINTTELTTEGAITYGVIATSMGSEESENITITNNNIDITGTANYAIELYKVSNTEVHNNTITVNGPFSMGIGYGYSPNGNATGNTITITGDSTIPVYVTEEFKPENVGIRIQNGTNNISLTDNTITTSDIYGQDTTIHSEPDNVTIANNQLTSSQGYGDDTIKAPTTATIENNTIETTTTIEVPETIITKTPTTITANVTTINGTPINGGTITFTQGNEAISQAEVIDGIATATVTFKQEADATIIASYTPESTGLSTSSAEATTSIQAPITQLNIEDVQLTAGQTVTLTAKVTDQTGNNITGGKVTFKVNGKTVKDEHGKVVYTKVVDGVATVEYTVADNMNGKDLNITATYSGTNKYNKATTSITTTVEKTTPIFTTESITATAGATIQLKANITDGDKVINTGKIVFKINGKTVKDEQGKVIYAKVVNNQVIVNYTLPSDMKDKDYNITATFISSDYERLEDTKVLSVTA